MEVKKEETSALQSFGDILGISLGYFWDILSEEEGVKAVGSEVKEEESTALQSLQSRRVVAISWRRFVAIKAIKGAQSHHSVTNCEERL